MLVKPNQLNEQAEIFGSLFLLELVTTAIQLTAHSLHLVSHRYPEMLA
tara:strand:+ start:267 stop:410 length:144 start_codon:yes stop_codon:yes gene_type:complete